MRRVRVVEILVTQDNHSAQNAIDLGRKVLEVTVRCNSDSTTPVKVGWNSNASNANTLQPSESTAYGCDGFYLDGNRLYIDFDSDIDTTGGRCLVTILTDGGEDQDDDC